MKVLNIVLSHQAPEQVARTLEWWDPICAKEDLLLAFGGAERDFSGVQHEPKVFISGPRLHTRDHQREFQSMTSFYKAVRTWLQRSAVAYEFIYFAEFDHLPLVADLNRRQIEHLEAENAEALAVNLQRIDGTSHPHYLYHLSNPQFHEWFARLSTRKEKEVILSMLGTGSFWRREAFEAIGAHDEPFPIYNEVYVPTLAHHLGYRIRDWGEQSEFVKNLGEFSDQIEAARARGAWTIHPVKRTPDRPLGLA